MISTLISDWLSLLFKAPGLFESLALLYILLGPLGSVWLGFNLPVRGWHWCFISSATVWVMCRTTFCYWSVISSTRSAWGETREWINQQPILSWLHKKWLETFSFTCRLSPHWWHWVGQGVRMRVKSVKRKITEKANLYGKHVILAAGKKSFFFKGNFLPFVYGTF